MKDIDLSGLGDYVNKTLKDLSPNGDISYQNEKWYKGTLTAVRGINLLLCVTLVVLFVLGGA